MSRGAARGAGIPVAKPRSDVYLAMVILTFVANLAACAIMYIEFTNLKQ